VLYKFARKPLEEISGFGKKPGFRPLSFPMKQIAVAVAEHADKRKQAGPQTPHCCY